MTAIGASLDRRDGPAKLTGEAIYAADINMPGLIHGALVLGPITCGRIRAVYTGAAERSAGVLAVLTPGRHPELFARLGLAADPGEEHEVSRPGEPLALVVAETADQAVSAAGLVRVDFAAGEAVATLTAALDQAYPPSEVLGEAPDSVRGDLAAGFGAAAAVVTATYTTPVNHHNPIERHAVVAGWEGDRLTVYTGTQGVFALRAFLARMLGIEAEAVRVRSPYVGGGFGAKGRGTMTGQVALAAEAARSLGRPVKVELSRAQMYGLLGYRQPTVQTVRIGAREDGKLTAVEHAATAQTSFAEDHAEPISFISRYLYSCPNVAVSHRLAKVNAPTPYEMRGPGHGPGSFALESAMDELAVELRIDPLELRRRNYPVTDPHSGMPWSSNSLREAWDAGAERFGWGDRPLPPRSMTDGRQLIGWGMASTTYPIFALAASAQACLRDDGSVVIRCGSHDLGTGTYTVLAQVAADALGVDPGLVSVELGDTTLPEAPMSVGQMTTPSVAPAVHAAAAELRQRLLALAISDPTSPVHGVNAAGIQLEDGLLVLAGRDRRTDSYRNLLRRRGQPELAVTVSTEPAASAFAQHAFGAHFAEVRVDCDLGEVRVSRWVCVAGVGRVLNRKTCASQLAGGVVFGIGMALTERTVVDRRDGRIVGPNLTSYLVPVCADVPDVEVVLLEEDDPHLNAVGAKGVGMVGTVGAAAAIANAIFHATGRRIRDLPITPGALL